MSDRRLISEEYTEIGNELIQMMPELWETEICNNCPLGRL